MQNVENPIKLKKWKKPDKTEKFFPGTKIYSQTKSRRKGEKHNKTQTEKKKKSRRWKKERRKKKCKISRKKKERAQALFLPVGHSSRRKDEHSLSIPHLGRRRLRCCCCCCCRRRRRCRRLCRQPVVLFFAVGCCSCRCCIF